MSFTILLLSQDADPSWPDKIKQAVPGAIAKAFADPKDALAEIETADAAYGTVPPELFARAKKLRWICASRAGLGGAYFYDALVNSDVVVTGMHGRYNEHLSTHAVAFLLAFARRFEHYLPQKRWQRGPGMIDLPTQTVLIVGVGGAGSEASKQCASFGQYGVPATNGNGESRSNEYSYSVPIPGTMVPVGVFTTFVPLPEARGATPGCPLLSANTYQDSVPSQAPDSRDQKWASVSAVGLPTEKSSV
jgi:lactate dehydrogenase-like 2-hydroxyacid dehydrogenase